jgi:hypothetical protein
MLENTTFTVRLLRGSRKIQAVNESRVKVKKVQPWRYARLMRLIVLFLCALCTTAKGALEGTHDLGDRSEAERAAQQVAKQQAFGYDPMIRQMQAQRERVREVSQQRRAKMAGNIPAAGTCNFGKITGGISTS